MGEEHKSINIFCLLTALPVRYQTIRMFSHLNIYINAQAAWLQQVDIQIWQILIRPSPIIIDCINKQQLKIEEHGSHESLRMGHRQIKQCSNFKDLTLSIWNFTLIYHCFQDSVGCTSIRQYSEMIESTSAGSLIAESR